VERGLREAPRPRACAFLLAGCGGAAAKPLTKARYEERAGAILKRFADAPKHWRVVMPATFDDDFTRAASDMEDLTPPPEIAQLHEQLVAGLEELAAAMQRLADSMDEGLAEYQRALDALAATRPGMRAEIALRGLRRRGFRLPSVLGVPGASKKI
jgi:hypothetical protein